MPRNGSGTYTRPQADYVPGTTILATSVNSDLNDMAQALTASIARDGQTTPTANIPLGGFRITGLGNGTSATDAATLGQVDGRAEIDLASASTTDIGAQASNNVRITGTTTITSFGTAANGVTRQLRFAAALTLTYNATSLQLPGLANITTAAGDTATAVSLGSGNWVVVDYTAATTAGARSAIGAAPQPQAAAGVGLFEAVDTSASVGNGYSLPAGGTWAYFMFRVNSSTGGVPGGSNMAAGVAAGGTTILAGLASHFIYGFAWRIA
jgi:hypothetical protein